MEAAGDDPGYRGGQLSGSLARKKAALNARRLARLTTEEGSSELFGTTQAAVAKLTVECPKCGQQLGATRFALHYERCLNKGSRGAQIGHSTALTAAAAATLPQSSSTTTPNPLAAAAVNTWSTPCGVCQNVETPESMLLCDGCSRVYHLWCLVPRLNEIPLGTWMCRKCSQRLVDSDDSIAILGVSRRKRNESRLSALQKVKRGRLAAGFDVVEFVCDLCDSTIQSNETRFRCLTCGEFDVCKNCKTKSGNGHRSTHKMVQLRLT